MPFAQLAVCVIAAHCHGLQACQAGVDLSTFGEPCPALGSYLSAEYRCKNGQMHDFFFIYTFCTKPININSVNHKDQQIKTDSLVLMMLCAKIFDCMFPQF